jgi:hypothetical protein
MASFLEYMGAASNPISKHYYGSKWAGEDAERAGEIQSKYNQMGIDALDQGYADVEEMYSPYSQAGLTALGQLQNDDFSTQMGEFEYGRDVNDFLDPSRDFQQDEMRRNMEQSAVARGNLQSGGFAQALQDRSQQMAQTDYANADNRMDRDKKFTYGQFRDRFANRRANNQQRFAQIQGISNLGTNANNAVANSRMQSAQGTSQMYNQLGQSQALAQTGQSSAMNAGFNNATDPNRVAGVVGSIFKGS